MDIAIIEPIGISETEIRRLLAGHAVRFFDSRGWSDERLLEQVVNTSIIALTNRPISAHRKLKEMYFRSKHTGHYTYA